MSTTTAPSTTTDPTPAPAPIDLDGDLIAHSHDARDREDVFEARDVAIVDAHDDVAAPEPRLLGG